MQLFPLEVLEISIATMKYGAHLAIISILIALHFAEAQVPSCWGLANGVLLANPQSSNKYYMCSDNIPIPMRCESNQQFCSSLNKCAASCSTVTTPTTKAPAATTPTTKAPAATTPTTKAPAATTPTTKAPAATTPTTKAPAATTPTTKAPAATSPTTKAPVTTAPKPDACKGLANGTLLPVTGSCDGYVMCVGEKSITQKCLGKRKFDAKTGSCSSQVCS